MLYLRDIVNAGFCGTKVGALKGAKPSIHRMVDETIFRQRGSIHHMEHEDARVQMANFANVPYEDQGVFHQILLGLSKHKDVFQKESVVIEWKTLQMPGWDEVKYVWFYDKETFTVIEPCYHFAVPDHYTPVYALLTAYLNGIHADSVKVMVVSALGDFTKTFQQPLQMIQLSEMLAQSFVASNITPGPQCLTCPQTSCSFNWEFGKLVFEWMKARQREEEIHKQLKEFLIMNGPTKVGAHVAYLKGQVRRYFQEKGREEFVAIANKHLTIDEMNKCFKPDAKTIFEMVDAGRLPASVKTMFSVSRSHSIETGLSL